jgi:hypothetical protein
MITLSGFYGDDSGSFTATIFIKQEAPVFHYESFRQTMIDAYGKGNNGERDDEMHVVIYFMREITEFEYEVNNSEASPQPQ